MGDITYVPTDEGWLYLAVVKDLCLKKVVGYAFSARIDTSLTLAVLEMSVKRQRPKAGLIFHSDRGAQYATSAYRQRLASARACHAKATLSTTLLLKISSAASSANWCITVGLLQDSRLRTPFLPTLRRFTILCALIPPSAGCLQHSLNALF